MIYGIIYENYLEKDKRIKLKASEKTEVDALIKIFEKYIIYLTENQRIYIRGHNS